MAVHALAHIAALLMLAASAVSAAAAEPGKSADKTAKIDSFAGQLEVTLGGELLSDYVYRGTTLSARRPAMGATIEARFGPFYVGSEVHSVRLPTDPVAELSLSAGFRKQFPELGNLELDLGATYLFYPRETPVGPVTDTDYWEASFKVSTDKDRPVSFTTTLAYSPNVSNSGAWSTYVAGGFKVELPKNFLPKEVDWSLSGDVGHSWFGNQSDALGGFPLPSYTHWRLGLEFNYDVFSLDLSYHDTNLSRETCFVFTGDPNAVGGGAVDPITNPAGLRSNWCGAAFVATLSVELSYPKSK